MSRVLRIVLVLAALMAIAAMPAAAGSSPKLHPSGFGEHSYAAWKAGEGLEDSTGNKDQALYFQKHTSTATVAAGVAVFNNIDGLPAESTPLEFWWRTDGHCGAGAPRFNVRIDQGLLGTNTYFVGCAAMTPGAMASGPDGTTYEQRSWPAGNLPSGTILSLAIVFDEGDDIGPGFVYLDNIRVGEWVWTSASDNGGGNTQVDAQTLELMWGAPLETLLMP